MGGLPVLGSFVLMSSGDHSTCIVKVERIIIIVLG